MLSKKDSVDIIMPNFNKGKFILKAVNSVIGQSYKIGNFISLMTIQMITQKK